MAKWPSVPLLLSAGTFLLKPEQVPEQDDDGDDDDRVPLLLGATPPLKPEQAPSTYNSCSSIFAHHASCSPCFVATGSFYRP